MKDACTNATMPIYAFNALGGNSWDVQELLRETGIFDPN